MKPMRKKYLLYGSLIIVGVFVLILIGETIRLKNTGFEGKSLWQWMELLVIPLVLAIGAFYLERSERAVERRAADHRAKLERELANDRQQETALQSYLDRMTELLLKENLRSSENEEVRNVARIRTLTVLRRLDATRKGMVLLFLYESGLIAEEPVIDLNGAELFIAELYRANLSNADLGGAYLSGAVLREANLSSVNLSDALLWDVFLNEANLRGANLSQSDLRGADLSNADLTGADLREANLYTATVAAQQLATAASLKGATMPDGTKHD